MTSCWKTGRRHATGAEGGADDANWRDTFLHDTGRKVLSITQKTLCWRTAFHAQFGASLTPLPPTWHLSVFSSSSSATRSQTNEFSVCWSDCVTQYRFWQLPSWAFLSFFFFRRDEITRSSSRIERTKTVLAHIVCVKRREHPPAPDFLLLLFFLSGMSFDRASPANRPYRRVQRERLEWDERQTHTSVSLLNVYKIESLRCSLTKSPVGCSPPFLYSPSSTMFITREHHILLLLALYLSVVLYRQEVARPCFARKEKHGHFMQFDFHWSFYVASPTQREKGLRLSAFFFPPVALGESSIGFKKE